MSRRMTDQDWAALDAVEVYGHAEAHTVASEYTWGWTSCWFESTGEMDHYMFNPVDGRYALTVDRALFWWVDEDKAEGRQLSRREARARERMLTYLTDREERGDMGPVEGFRTGWVGES